LATAPPDWKVVSSQFSVLSSQ